MSFFRKFKFEESIGQYLEKSLKLEEILADGESQKDDIFLRSAKYKHLKEIYDDYFLGKVSLQNYQKELIMEKMNDLFQQGLVEEEQFQNGQIEYRNTLYDFAELEQIFRHKWEVHKGLVKKKMGQLALLFAEVTEEEATEQLQLQLNLPPQHSGNIILNLKKRLEKNGSTLKKYHVEGTIEKFRQGRVQENKDQSEDITFEQHLLLEEEREKQKPPMTLTDLPDLNTFVAEEWKDLSGLGINQITPIFEENQWFNTPLSDKQAEHQKKQREGLPRNLLYSQKEIEEKVYGRVFSFSDGEEF